MLKFFLVLVVCMCVPFVFSWRGLILGTGRWLVLNIVPCDNPEQYEMPVTVSRKKINRTHDCFDVYMDLKRVTNCGLAIKIDIYQLVDGGFKYFQTMTDDCACAFLMKHAKENFQQALIMAKIDPPDCPIFPGPINLTNFVMDYSKLPKNGVYGTFEAVVQILYKEQKIGCIKTTLNFDERNEDESYEDDDVTDLHKLL